MDQRTYIAGTLQVLQGAIFWHLGDLENEWLRYIDSRRESLRNLRLILNDIDKGK